MGKNKNKYIFSVVIPIYNADKYIQETIESVLNQDIGFRDHIQMILVNDGSTDDTEQICMEYQKKFPENICYIKQENCGVSAARNHGADYIEGKYVNFLDADDKWSTDTFLEVYEFFEKYGSEVSLVSCKQEFFEAKSGLHPLSRDKYEKNRVIDILDDYDKIQFHVSASFIKADVVKKKTFNLHMCYGEDARYVSEIILDDHKYGVVAKPTHFYRKREDNSSALQNRGHKKEWYFETPFLFYEELMQISREKWEKVIPYVQYLTCYDVQWRLNDQIETWMTGQEQQKYLEIIRQLLLQCEDDIILQQKSINLRKKLFLLSLKYGEDLRKKIFYYNGRIFWDNIVLGNLEHKTKIEQEETESAGKWNVSGKITSPVPDDMQFSLNTETGLCYPLSQTQIFEETEQIWGKEIGKIIHYNMSYPSEEGRTYMVGKYREIYRIEWKDDDFKTASDDLHTKYAATIIINGNNMEKIEKTLTSLEKQTLTFQNQIQVLLRISRKNIFPYLKYCKKNVKICRKLTLGSIKGAYVCSIDAGKTYPKQFFAKLQELSRQAEPKLDLLLQTKSAEKKEYMAVTDCMDKFTWNREQYFFSMQLNQTGELLPLLETSSRWEAAERMIQIFNKTEYVGFLENAQSGGQQPMLKNREDCMRKLPDMYQKITKSATNDKEKTLADLLVTGLLTELMKSDIVSTLEKESRAQTEVWLQSVLQQISDYVIYKGCGDSATRVYAFSLKYAKDIRKDCAFRNGKLLFHNLMLYNLKRKEDFCFISRIYEGEECILTAEISNPLMEEEISFVIADGIREYTFELQQRMEPTEMRMGYIVSQKRRYLCRLPKENDVECMQIICRYRGKYPSYLGTAAEFWASGRDQR